MATGLTNPSGIHGWECNVIVPPEIFFTGVTYSGDVINVATAPDFAVGIAVALPPTADDFIVLATINFFVSPGVTNVFLDMEPSSLASIPDSMVYVPGDDIGALKSFKWSSGGPEFHSFGFNSGPLVPPIEAVPQTWGRVKNLYR
jgi:hypothetical protein